MCIFVFFRCIFVSVFLHQSRSTVTLQISFFCLVLVLPVGVGSNTNHRTFCLFIHTVPVTLQMSFFCLFFGPYLTALAHSLSPLLQLHDIQEETGGILQAQERGDGVT